MALHATFPINDVWRHVMIDPANIVEDDYGKGPRISRDRKGSEVQRGDLIRVLEVDPRILAPLGGQEVAELLSFIGESFPIRHINFDGSVLVEKEWIEDGGVIMGHGLAVFPTQFEVENDDS